MISGLFRRGTKYPCKVANSTKSSISVMISGTIDGLLPPYIIYKAKEMYFKWALNGPAGAVYNRTESGWFDMASFGDYFDKIVVPWARRREGKKLIIGRLINSMQILKLTLPHVGIILASALQTLNSVGLKM